MYPLPEHQTPNAGHLQESSTPNTQHSTPLSISPPIISHHPHVPESLSKSDFIRSLGCVKRAWLHRYRKDLRETLDAASLDRIETGQRIGALARLRYPDGVMVPESDDPVAATSALIESGATCLFEATLDSGAHRARVDVLWKEADGTWVIDEVKSKTVKPIAILERSKEAFDLGYQVLTARGAGLDVSAARLVLVDSSYVWFPARVGSDQMTSDQMTGGRDARDDDLMTGDRMTGGRKGLQLSLFDIEEATATSVSADPFDPELMLGVVDLGLAVGKLGPEIEEQALAAISALASTEEPQVQTNTHCKKCDFVDYCVPAGPPHSILRLPGIRPKEVAALRLAGCETIDQIPDDYGLTAERLRVREAILTGKPQIGEALAARLSEVSFPAAFIDYETYGPAFSLFPGTRPYQPICFQWSAHVLAAADSQPVHHEFLSSNLDDPRTEFCRSLWETVKDCASIVHYSAFEVRQVEAMVREGIPLASELLALLQERSIDLHKIVEANVYLTEFNGSTSIKVVLPALVPTISYKDLEIGDGQAAGVAFREMVDPLTSSSRRQALREALLSYCELDTLAMVEIYRVLLGMMT
jgi:hypothetical protein